MNFKNKLKRIPFIKKIVGYRNTISSNDSLKYDYKIYTDHLIGPEDFGNKHQLERDILVYSHMIEKGLSHKMFRVRFGEKNVKYLSDLVKRYYSFESPNDYVLKVGVSALSEYIRANSSERVDVSDIVNLSEDLKEHDLDFSGVKTIKTDDFFSNNAVDFYSFSKSRRSFRGYDIKSLPINPDELIKPLDLSMTAPSACNRQAVKVNLITNKELKNKLCEIQGGSNGFYENAGALIILSSDLNSYQKHERRLPMMDGGIYSMNLLYSLHYYEYASCILNGSLTQEKEMEVKKLLKLPDNEVIVSFILVSKLPPSEHFILADAVRKRSTDISRIIT